MLKQKKREGVELSGLWKFSSGKIYNKSWKQIASGEKNLIRSLSYLKNDVKS